jgi:hypothetical protein
VLRGRQRPECSGLARCVYFPNPQRAQLSFFKDALAAFAYRDADSFNLGFVGSVWNPKIKDELPPHLQAFKEWRSRKIMILRDHWRWSLHLADTSGRPELNSYIRPEGVERCIAKTSL